MSSLVPIPHAGDTPTALALLNETTESKLTRADLRLLVPEPAPSPEIEKAERSPVLVQFPMLKGLDLRRYNGVWWTIDDVTVEHEPIPVMVRTGYHVNIPGQQRIQLRRRLSIDDPEVGILRRKLLAPRMQFQGNDLYQFKVHTVIVPLNHVVTLYDCLLTQMESYRDPASNRLLIDFVFQASSYEIDNLRDLARL